MFVNLVNANLAQLTMLMIIRKLPLATTLGSINEAMKNCYTGLWTCHLGINMFSAVAWLCYWPMLESQQQRERQKTLARTYWEIMGRMYLKWTKVQKVLMQTVFWIIVKPFVCWEAHPLWLGKKNLHMKDMKLIIILRKQTNKIEAVNRTHW